MGWEWRLFYPKKGTDSLFSIINGTSETIERRTDVYKLLPTAACLGLKARGGSGNVELKVRLETKERGWELWTKMKVPVLSSVELTDGIVGALGQFVDQYPHLHGIQQSIKDKVFDASSLVELRVDKSRIRFLGDDGVVVEQTDMVVYDSTGSSLGEYRSIAVDGDTKSKTPEKVMKQMGDELLKESLICGYPEFLESLGSQAETSSLPATPP